MRGQHRQRKPRAGALRQLRNGGEFTPGRGWVVFGKMMESGAEDQWGKITLYVLRLLDFMPWVGRGDSLEDLKPRSVLGRWHRLQPIDQSEGRICSLAGEMSLGLGLRQEWQEGNILGSLGGRSRSRSAGFMTW